MPLEVQPKPQLLPPTDGRMPPLISPGGERLSLMEVWRVLMKQRYVILAVTVLSFAGGLWYALRTPPVYESIARIEIRPQETPNIGIQQLISQNQPGASSQNDLQTEMQILQSDTVVYGATASGLVPQVGGLRGSVDRDVVRHDPYSQPVDSGGHVLQCPLGP